MTFLHITPCFSRFSTFCRFRRSSSSFVLPPSLVRWARSLYVHFFFLFAYRTPRFSFEPQCSFCAFRTWADPSSKTFGSFKLLTATAWLIMGAIDLSTKKSFRAALYLRPTSISSSRFCVVFCHTLDLMSAIEADVLPGVVWHPAHSPIHLRPIYMGVL